MRASSISRAAVEAICERLYDDELQALSAVDVLTVGGWPVLKRRVPVRVAPGVLHLATVLEHDTREPVGEVRFRG